MIRFLKSLYLNTLLYLLLGLAVLLLLTGYFVPAFFPAGQMCLGLVTILFVGDLVLLYAGASKKVEGSRKVEEKWSNGEENPVAISLKSHYRFPVSVEVIDEVPVQFQVRRPVDRLRIPGLGSIDRRYTLRPVKRGEYQFGALYIYVSSPVGMVRRRFKYASDKVVAVYPSFVQMRRYEFLAIGRRLQEVGVKQIRRLGHSMEFEQIREYVDGDDYRVINWKATARKAGYMVNQYREERSQPVYCVIDKGRNMKMPFNGMSLLDYAINASLVLCNIALYKQDKAGLVTFSERMGIHLPASRKATQMLAITDLLYKQKTRYLESNYEVLFANIRRKFRQRSLVLLFTNFESVQGMQRQLPYLRRIAKDHLLVVIFFENTELSEILSGDARNTDEIYLKTIAEKFAFEKRQIVKELQMHGIQALLTPPEGLTVNTLNKYLELKSRNVI